MKKTVITFLFLAVATMQINAQVGINTQNPAATFDITAKTTDGSKPEGMLAPRLTGNQIQAADAQYNNTFHKGMIIYATAPTTAPAGKTINITTEGYYYFDGLVWQKMGNGAYTGSTSVALNGNSFQRAALTGDAIATANSNATTVVGLLGRPLVTTVPQNENILSYNGTGWEPKSLASQSIPRQIVSVSVSGTQFYRTIVQTELTVAFPVKNFDSYNAWDVGTNSFTVPANMQGTYTVDMMMANKRDAYGGSTYWVMTKLQKSTDNGATWVNIMSNIMTSDTGYSDNGNSLFWTGNLNVGDKLRVYGMCLGNGDPTWINNTIVMGNLAITKL
ncbi:hypothetical protein [Chryseobacterium sp. Leaf405]|uniref:hypothetical protein n=1 Tax=Chryseobacterium sp. Leaf405 TaxID=1736367 RepID=UPI000A6D5D9F|nr:hypothetical protein [Chryseobacterium sp. Leaf405]